MAQINLRKLTDINIESGASNGTKMAMGATNKANFAKEVNKLSHENNKIVFAGQDYKGTFIATADKSSTAIEGSLELYLERPENHFTIKDVKIGLDATNGKHTFKGTGKDGGATIDLVFNTGVHGVADDKLTIIEKDSGWFTTGLTLNGITPMAGSSLKFGEWSNYDLSDQSYVEISFT